MKLQSSISVLWMALLTDWLADRFFCLYTAQNFTAVTLVGFGSGQDSTECGHLQTSNSNVATVAILPVVLHFSETVDT